MQQTHGKVVQSVAPASLTGATNGTAVDCAGYHEAILIVEAGAIAVGGTLDGKLQEDDNSAFSSPADVTGAAITQLGDTDDNKSRWARVKLGGRQQYLRAVLTQATGAVTAGASILLLRPKQGSKVETSLTEATGGPAFDV